MCAQQVAEVPVNIQLGLIVRTAKESQNELSYCRVVLPWHVDGDKEATCFETSEMSLTYIISLNHYSMSVDLLRILCKHELSSFAFMSVNLVATFN